MVIVLLLIVLNYYPTLPLLYGLVCLSSVTSLSEALD
jgi:hypothetical protein